MIYFAKKAFSLKLPPYKKEKMHIEPYLLEAMSFDETYFDIPVRECGDSFISLKELFKKAKITVFFSQNTVGDRKKIFAVRSGLAEPLLNAVRTLQEQNLTLRFEYAYRSVDGQRRIFQKMFNRIVDQYPDLDRESQLRTAGVYAAWNLATAAHVGGAAVDVSLVTMENQEIDLGAHYLDTGPKTTTDTTLISQEAQENRAILTNAMKNAGFANYPYEFWHFSLGDKIAAKIQNKEYAIYGPVIFTSTTQPVKYIPESEQIARFID